MRLPNGERGPVFQLMMNRLPEVSLTKVDSRILLFCSNWDGDHVGTLA